MIWSELDTGVKCIGTFEYFDETQVPPYSTSYPFAPYGLSKS